MSYRTPQSSQLNKIRRTIVRAHVRQATIQKLLASSWGEGAWGEKFRRPSPERRQSPFLPSLAAIGLGCPGVYSKWKAEWALGLGISFIKLTVCHPLPSKQPQRPQKGGLIGTHSLVCQSSPGVNNCLHFSRRTQVTFSFKSFNDKLIWYATYNLNSGTNS